MIGKGATPSFFAIANYNYTLTLLVSIYIRQAFGVIIGFEIKSLYFINLRVTSL